LRFHGVLRRAVKMLDAEVLFDPLEKQFDLPTLFVKRGDGFRREHEIVCQKHEALAVSGSQNEMRRMC